MKNPRPVLFVIFFGKGRFRRIRVDPNGEWRDNSDVVLHQEYRQPILRPEGDTLFGKSTLGELLFYALIQRDQILATGHTLSRISGRRRLDLKVYILT